MLVNDQANHKWLLLYERGFTSFRENYAGTFLRWLRILRNDDDDDDEDARKSGLIFAMKNLNFLADKIEIRVECGLENVLSVI